MTIDTVPSVRKFEYQFTASDFEGLREIITKNTGIELPESKKSLMYSRLVRRVRHHGMANFSEYLNFVRSSLRAGDENEMMAIVNAMTTNVTHFFREPHHFEHLEEMLPEMLKKYGKVNIWSSACSIGAEPWSIAMVVHKFMQNNPAAQIKIHASDIDSNVIKTARKGIYELQESEVQNNPLLKKYLKRTSQPLSARGEMEGCHVYQIDAALKPLISFHQINLLKPFPMMIPDHCHFIFCRNVIIYFSKDTKRELFSRLKEKQQADSFLYIGHSESLLDICDEYTPLGKTIYTRK